MNNLQHFKDLMRKENLNEIVIKTFCDYYEKLCAGEKGKLSEIDITRPEGIVDYNSLGAPGNSFYEKLVVIKLNGGLGTSMGLTKAKSLLEIKDGNTFLDLIAQQILYLRKSTKKDIPLMFMNSFNTQADTLEFLQKYPELPLPRLPLDFLQNKFPKIKQSDFSPLKTENEKSKWNPPGHGEIYTAMMISGVLDNLLENGIEYAFISNSDNLGAVPDEKILGWFAKNKVPFLMEVCERTEADKKGGHLAQTKSGQLILREVAQCPEDEVEDFQNIEKYSYFNTNNLWVNLKALKEKLVEYDFVLPLSLIVNPKEVEGEKVYQIETAMGAAISVFKGSRAMRVNRDRFAPVKKYSDLEIVRSADYILTDDFRLVKR
jgi:UTP--glucose-1-phosphate uridylyltransferase